MSSKERNPTIEIEKEIYEKIKEIAFDNRKKIKPFVNDLLLEVINKGGLSKKQDDENRISNLEEKMKNLIAQNEYSQKIIEMTAGNTIQLLQDILPNELENLPISQNFTKHGYLIGKKATNDEMVIFDELLQKEISVSVQNNFLVCSHDKTNTCEHIKYSLLHASFFIKLVIMKVNIPYKEFINQNLGRFENK